jgi:hypothetical protein
MDEVCKYIHSHHYTILEKYRYFSQDDNDEEHYVGGNVSITTHIIKKLADFNDIIKVIDINEECGIVIFKYIRNERRGSICEVKSNGIHYWLVNLYRA